MSSEGQQQSSEGEPPQQTGGGFSAVKEHVKSHMVETALWATRALTLYFCLAYLIPIFSNPYSSYQKALMSNAATSALRLHQRIPQVSLSREFFALLFLEDSAHYLIYSLIFIYSAPITMVLIPVFLFALLHFASYSLTFLDLLGQNTHLVTRFLISLVEYQQRNILRGAAFIEILLLPLTIVSVFTGRVGLVTPFVYYRFLGWRYASRRNPYTRNMFYELRISAQDLANRSYVPGGVRQLVHTCIGKISALAPQIPTQ